MYANLCYDIRVKKEVAMKVFALVGPSGTGKSHRSALIAHKKGIDYIIDDGLLIKGNHVLAGRSAKREKTRMAATKRAIFSDPEHADQVREAIEMVKPPSILVLGISNRMVEQITKTLNIPQPEEIIHIEDIASPNEISLALESRVKQNRHVIPIPTFAIEKDFPGYLLENIRAFFLGKEKIPAQTLPKTLEHTIVRPLYSSLGNYYLSENVIEQIISHVAEKNNKEIVRVKKSLINSSTNGLIISLDVSLDLGVKNIPALLSNLQKEIKHTLESTTGFQISRIDINARQLITDKENKRTRKEPGPGDSRKKGAQSKQRYLEIPRK